MFRWCLLSRQIHLVHSICVITSMSKQHPGLFFSRRFFGSHNCNWKVFSSILALLGPFCSCVRTSCEASVVLGKQFPCIIRRLLLLSKGSKLCIHNVYLAAFDYFRPGIMCFDRPIRIKHFMPCARVVDKQPWVRGCLVPGVPVSSRTTVLLGVTLCCRYTPILG